MQLQNVSKYFEPLLCSIHGARCWGDDGKQNRIPDPGKLQRINLKQNKTEKVFFARWLEVFSLT